MKVTVLLLLVGFCSSVLAGGLDPTTEKEIAYLISYLGSSGCQFNRNGAWYSASRAVSHLNRKYEYLRKRNLPPIRMHSSSTQHPSAVRAESHISSSVVTSLKFKAAHGSGKPSRISEQDQAMRKNAANSGLQLARTACRRMIHI